MKTTKFRTETLRSRPRGVDVEGGVIHGATIMQLGRVNDARPWIVDDTTLDQVVDFGNRSKRGLKARFTHPNMCQDGLGNHLGGWVQFERKGDKAIADLPMSESAYDTPRGDLASYTLEFGDDYPEHFGVSVAGVLDVEAMEAEQFTNAEGERLQPIRFKRLVGADIVDEPAATRGGLFAEIGNDKDLPALATWILDTHFKGVDAEEVLSHFMDFATKYFGRELATTNFSIDGDSMADNQQTNDTPDTRAELKRYIDKFGDIGGRWFSEGKDFAECVDLFFNMEIEKREKHIDELTSQLQTRDETIAELQAKLEAAQGAAGEDDAGEFSHEGNTKKSFIKFANS